VADFDPKAFVAKANAADATAFDKSAFLSKAGVAPTTPYRPPDDVPTNAADAVAGHFLEDSPFGRQLAAAMGAAKMKLQGSPMDFGENYKQLLLQEQRLLDRSKKESPTLSTLGSVSGLANSVAMLPAQTLPALAGMGAVMGLSDATANPENGLGNIAFRTGASAVAAPLFGAAMEKVVVPAVAPVARIAGRGLEAAGGKLADLAGWLKVNSIHPTPKLGEAMESIPGGKPAVGLELLQRGVGGLTKSGTAEQASAASSSANKAIGDIAASYDSAGGAPIDLNPALAQGLQHAAKLQSEPTTKAAGQKLEQLVYDYAQKYQGKPVSAAEALELKRSLGAAAYKQGVANIAGDTVAGDFGAGMGKLERAVDETLDDALGPSFERANLASRRLSKAAAAADRQDARGASNHLLGLLPTLAGVGGYAGHGGTGAIGAALGATLLQKYGAQSGARTLYGMARGLQMAPGLLSSMAPAGAAAAGLDLPQVLESGATRSTLSSLYPTHASRPTLRDMLLSSLASSEPGEP
jgi:hypothetical protein